MSRRNKLWTRERIILALARFVSEHGLGQIKNYVLLQRELGKGLPNSERPYPSDLTVRVEFPTMADAWRAAGVDMPEKPRKASKPKAKRASIADRVLSGISKGAACKCEAYRAERDALASALSAVLDGDAATIALVRAGRLLERREAR